MSTQRTWINVNAISQHVDVIEWFGMLTNANRVLKGDIVGAPRHRNNWIFDLAYPIIHPHNDVERPFRRFSEFMVLTRQDRAEVLRLADEATLLPQGAVIRDQGVEPNCVYLLSEGWVATSIDLEDGTRQITKVHLPGDLMGMPSMSLAETADTLTALTPVVVGRIPLGRFARLFVTSPRFAMGMFLSSQRERIALMDALTRIGRTSSLQRMAWLLLDLHERLTAVALCKPTWFDLMLSQEQVADILGITHEHANRTFRRLRRDGLIRRDGRRLEIVDRRGLAELANWQQRELASNPKWLLWDVGAAFFKELAEGGTDTSYLHTDTHRRRSQGELAEVCDGS